MANSAKAEEFEHLDNTEAAVADCISIQEDQEEVLKAETTTTTTTTSSPTRDRELDSASQTEGEPGLLSMPCLMKELRRDSPESQPASTGSDKPASRRVYESDSSNPCMLSPSSSGHLADSDTLSSGEEGAAPRTDQGEGNMETGADPGHAVDGPAAVAAGRKSRRTRSESEMTNNAMAAKKNRCQHPGAGPGAGAAAGVLPPEKQTNGKLAKVKGHRSQKHKERMRLLRQKREAAARKKYNLLQDSSTSDSELTCDSSTSSSEDDDDTSAGSKTINTDIPGNTHTHTPAAPVSPPGPPCPVAKSCYMDVINILLLVCMYGWMLKFNIFILKSVICCTILILIQSGFKFGQLVHVYR